MTSNLKRFIHLSLDLWNILKGTRYYTLNKIQDSLEDGYIINTKNGFKVQIYCKESSYKCVFVSKWAKDKTMSIYHVYAICSPDTPEEIKNKFSAELRISSILHSWSSQESQKIQAIKAYVDLVFKGVI